MDPEHPGLFRKDALRHHLGEAEEGVLLQLSPVWTRWTLRFLVTVVGVGLIYLFTARVPVYEAGPAVLRVDGAIRMQPK